MARQWKDEDVQDEQCDCSRFVSHLPAEESRPIHFRVQLRLKLGSVIFHKFHVFVDKCRTKADFLRTVQYKPLSNLVEYG